MIGRIVTHARKRLKFEGSLSTAKRLSACKQFLRLENEMIYMRHRGGESGLKVAQARSALIDVLLQHLLDYTISFRLGDATKAAPPIALAALGGYGRAELSPLSDIDIMFLYPSNVKAAKLKELQQIFTDEVLYILWDLGLKVGHSSRTIDDVFAEARADIQTKTSLLESRLVAGSSQLFATFAQAYSSFYLKENPKGYISARLEDQAARRAKYGDTVFLQEPDIKNGVGGLRDYQNALWMARVKLGINSLDQLVELNYLRPKELRDFQRGYNFLLRVRNDLHFHAKRPNDLLTLDIQPKLAQRLGYTSRAVLVRVEEFMRDYYRHAQAIYRISKIVENRLALSIAVQHPERISFAEAIRARRTERIKRLDGFVLRGRELAYERPTVFEDDPRRLIRVFRHCQQLEAHLDFELETLIRDSLPLINNRVIRSPEANTAFRSILQEAGRVFPILNSMHELGVLAKFIPEWGKLSCLVQHEYYHRYTADVHTLNTIRELDLVFANPEPLFAKYLEELRETPTPTLLYLILLLHDIGKAVGIEKHAENGVKIAIPILQRLGIDASTRDTICFVIREHLLMSRVWQKRDVEDPQTSAAFAEAVGDVERLRLLYVHTFCDARGTASSLWNGYKDTLHTTLFLQTRERFLLGEGLEKKTAELLQMTQRELMSQKIPGVSSEEIAAHFQLLPERYFVHTPNDEIALHLQMVNRLLKSIAAADSVGALLPVIDWKDDLNRSLTVVNVITWDRAGLFYKLAGAFSVAGLNILSAKAISRADHIAIDTFYVVEPGRGVVGSQQVMELFQKTAEESLVRNVDLLPQIQAQARKLRRVASPGALLEEPTPLTVDVYHDTALNRTIIEIQTGDQIGLLYKLARAIYEHGYDISFARINTERGVAVDTFYIESIEPTALPDQSRLVALRQAIEASVNDTQPAAS
jgi:[protein-PII] uridylyltransferase